MSIFTRHHVYKVIYAVIKANNLHLGADKASRVANQYAVKHTWRVYTNTEEYTLFAYKFMSAYVILATRGLA